MKPQIIFILMLLGISLGSSCYWDKEEDQFNFFWAQTKCAEPWTNEVDLTEAEMEQLVVAYLDDQGIQVFNIWTEFDDSFAQACEACICTTGTKIFVSVEAFDRQKILDLGFQSE